MNKVHLAKALKERGNYTKSEVYKLIEENRVLVNGIKQPLSYVVLENDIITVDNIKLEKVEKVGQPKIKRHSKARQKQYHCLCCKINLPL